MLTSGGRLRSWAGVASCAIVLAAVLPGPGALGQSASTPETGVRIRWTPCTDPDLRRGNAECAFVRVPLDHSRPRDRAITLALSRVRARVPENQRRGVMLGNPGGPGGSGLNLALLGGFVPGGAGDLYDWIGFDPRGVGASRPALSCDPTYFEGRLPDYRPANRVLPLGEELDWVAKSRAYARACGRR
ncbi:MAG: alpha/beta hydrolase, partial [Sporichthyaceae bacterium]